MPRRNSFWSVLNAMLGGVAAIVTAGTGVYLALKSESPPAVATNVVSKVPAAATDTDQPTGTQYDRTPWLGVELRQDGEAIPLHSVGDAWDRFEARLGSGPFEIHISRQADDPSIGILAWHDDSLFEAAGPELLQLGGTGIAGGEFAVPILYLDKEGFNYYDTQRLKRIDDGKYAILVSSIGTGDLELPLKRFTGPLYLIIFRDQEGFEMTVPRREFEMFTLRR